MRTLLLLLILLLICVLLAGCGSTPTVPPPQPPTPMQRMDAIGSPRQIQKQITVMGKNGPETITVTETIGGSMEKRPIAPEPIKSLPRDASRGEKITKRPTQKEP